MAEMEPVKETSEVLCPECASQTNTLYKKVRSLHADKEYSINTCDNCKLSFTNPFGVEKSFYTEETFGYERIKSNLFEVEYRSKLYSKILDKYSVKNLIEVGCMFGIFLNMLKDKYEVEGIEIGKEPAEECVKNGIKCFNGTIEEYIESNHKKFDVVCGFHTIEHTTNVSSFLQGIREILNDEGILLLSMPNFSNSGMLKSSWGWNLVPAHQYHFTEESMRRLIDKNGFDVLEVHYKGGDSAFYLSSVYNLLKLKGSKVAESKMAKLIYRLTFMFLSRPLYHLRSEEMVVVTRKR